MYISVGKFTRGQCGSTEWMAFRIRMNICCRGECSFILFIYLLLYIHVAPLALRNTVVEQVRVQI